MLWKTDDNSTASTLRCSLTQSLKGSVATLGHSNKTRPWGQQRAAGSRGVSEMVQAPSCPEPAGHMCFMPFSKSAAHQRVVKWFIPLQPLQNHKRLWGFWRVKYPAGATASPRRQAVQFSHAEQGGPKEYFYLNTFLSL